MVERELRVSALCESFARPSVFLTLTKQALGGGIGDSVGGGVGDSVGAGVNELSPLVTRRRSQKF